MQKNLSNKEVKPPTGSSRKGAQGDAVDRPMFTPGPYAMREAGLIVSVSGNVRFLAQMEPHGSGGRMNEQDRRDAALFMAAPALYEMALQCRTLVSTLNHLDSVDRMSLDAAVDLTMYKINAALALDALTVPTGEAERP